MSLVVGGVNGQLTIDQGDETDLTITAAQLKRLVAEQNRTWQNVTSSRASGVVYTNDTDADIVISVTIETLACALTILVDGLTISLGRLGNVASENRVTCYVHVPFGSTYQANANSGNLTGWRELR
jgi:hypothetical protein